MGIDIEVGKFLFQIAQFLLTGGIGIYVYMSKKNTVTNDRISTMEENFDRKMEVYVQRLVKVETLCDKAPTHENLSDLYSKINNVSDCVSRVEGAIDPQFKAVNHTLGIIQTYLLSNGNIK
ncbi:MAG TPA: hypothetical protein VK974_00745 [Methylophilaceae bacterium]|nr:hypothetical protein [Methylophilaceae bacterium]